MSIVSLLPVLITFAGIYFLFKLRFFLFLHPRRCAKILCEDLSGRQSFRAFTLALAGTLGVGNVVGVAYGISVGGAGCVFWLVVSSIFAAIIKYAECTAVADGHSSTAELILKSFKHVGGVFSKTYSFLCLLLSLTMGSALQSSALVSSAKEVIKLPPVSISLTFCALCAALVLWGVKYIEGATAYIIPTASVIYVIICLAIIFTNISSLPTVLLKILREAFSLRSAYGGVSSYLMLSAMREGYARGLLSNEAGAGTSAVAHARSFGKSPASVGLRGAVEVFFDTTLLCTLTGLAVLLGSDSLTGSGVEIIISAFSGVLHSFSGCVVLFLILAFVYSTVICWYFYGLTAFGFLGGGGYKHLFSALFLLAVFLGGKISEGVLITLSDSILTVMSVITLITLIKSSARILHLTEHSGLIKLKHSDVGEGLDSKSRKA